MCVCESSPIKLFHECVSFVFLLLVSDDTKDLILVCVSPVPLSYLHDICFFKKLASDDTKEMILVCVCV